MDRKLTDLIKLKFGKVAGYGIWLTILLLSLSVARNMAKVASIKKDVLVEKDRIVKMQKENQALETQISGMQSPDFIEKQVRNKLGLVKVGEAVVILPDEATLKRLAPVIDSSEDALPDANWQKWLALFI